MRVSPRVCAVYKRQVPTKNGEINKNLYKITEYYVGIKEEKLNGRYWRAEGKEEWLIFRR